MPEPSDQLAHRACNMTQIMFSRGYVLTPPVPTVFADSDEISLSYVAGTLLLHWSGRTVPLLGAWDCMIWARAQNNPYTLPLNSPRYQWCGVSQISYDLDEDISWIFAARLGLESARALTLQLAIVESGCAPFAGCVQSVRLF